MQQGPPKTFPLMLIRAAGLPLQWLNALPVFPMKTPADALAAQIQDAFDRALAALPVETGLRTAVYNARREFFQKKKMPSGTFYQVARATSETAGIQVLLKKLEAWASSGGNAAERARYETALLDNYRLLQKVVESEQIQRGLIFSSHVLLAQLPEFVQCPVSKFGKKERRIALSMLQYFSRATVKTSPFSRWTTVDMQRMTDDWEIPVFSALKPQTTPNVAILPALYELLLHDPAFRRSLSVALNPCLVQNDTAVQEWLFFDGENEAFQQIASDAIINLVIGALLGKHVAIPFPDLLALLEEKIEAPVSEIEKLALELLDLGLLEWQWPEKGLSSGWCGGLYQFLGFIPAPSPLVVETAQMLQWLRTAARTLPFQPPEEAATTQREAHRQLRDFFEKNGSAAPDIPVEQIFFEDVAEDVSPGIGETDLNGLIAELRDCWLGRDTAKIPERYAQLCAFAAAEIRPGQDMDFLPFCRKFIEKGPETVSVQDNFHPPETRKIGALLQVFRDEASQYRAVLNGLFPGGGKMFARWTQLFPAGFTEEMADWFAEDESPVLRMPFPWQGWSNANFQPRVAHSGLSTPEGRTWFSKDVPPVRLGNLAVRLTANGPRLIDRFSGKTVVFSDLGLEAPESRPPAVQVLWHLGMPYVSIEALLPARRWERAGEGCHYLPRLESGRLVLARKTWRIDAGVTKRWLDVPDNFEFFRLVRNDLSGIGLSPRFFARYLGEKPQFFDLESPLSMLLFSKTLKHNASPLILTEMLPLPEHCIVEKDGLRAAEFVVEFEV